MATVGIDIHQAIANRRDINVSDLARIAVEDHTARTGCVFLEDAASRAIEIAGISSLAIAATLPSEALAQLADILEGMETNCPHASTQGDGRE
jgi:hypothetical protein